MSALGRRTRISTIIAVVALLFALFPPGARSGTSVVTSCDQIQPALDAAADGDVVRMNIATLCTIDTSITLPTNLTVTLEGAPGVTTGFQPASGFGGPLLQGTDILGTTLRNLSVTGANSAASGNAIDISGQSAPLLEDVHVYGNTSTAPDRSPVVINNDQPVPGTRASATQGGPVGAGDVLPIELDNYYGGGIRADFRNEGESGGAGHIFRTDTPLIVRDSLFMNNNATNRGGGLAVFGTGSISLIRTKFLDNGAADRGAGFYVTGSDTQFSFDRVTVNRNKVEGPGNVDSGGGFIFLGTGTRLDIMRSSFLNNSVVSTDGGATDGGGLFIQSDGASSVYMGSSTVWQNHADGMNSLGGGLGYINFSGGDTGPLYAVNTIFGNNSVGINGFGGGLGTVCATNCPSRAHLLHNTIVNNVAGDNANGRDAALLNTTANVYNSIIYSSGTENDLHYNEVPTIKYSDVCATDGDPSDGPGNICRPARFVNPSAWNYHLRNGPGVDAGSPGLLDLSQAWTGPWGMSVLGGTSKLTKDFEGDKRVIDANADGKAKPDMGADEMIGRSKISVGVDTTKQKVNVDGKVVPKQPGKVTVTLYEKKGGRFDKVDQKKDKLSSTSKYEVTFARPDEGNCKVKARFGGSKTNKPATKSKTFAC